ncbi:rubrerythrin family protein [Thermodesulfobacteriota bacterium]
MPEQSIKNLMEAFAGESQANRRYLVFAQKAEEEGFKNIARLFRAAAESETIHAHNHLRAMDGVKSTLENAEEAWQGEKDEFTAMYPMFMDQAKRDANNEALQSFFWANEAEKAHGEFYERAIEVLKQGKDLKLNEVYVCDVCGFTIEGAPPEKCPTCGKGKEHFKAVD